jgi:hypothetical protein
MRLYLINPSNPLVSTVNVNESRWNRYRVWKPLNPTPRTDEPEAPTRTSVSERFRRLKWNEVVWRGDFVADERLGLQPWEGPGGFRADAFVRPIYRRKETERFRPTATPESKREAGSSA